MDGLGDRSFGLLVLILALFGLAPGTSTIAGLLLGILAPQMALARLRPVLPQGIARRRLDPRHLTLTVGWAVPVLRFLERLSRPRWPTPEDATRRVVGIAVLALGALLLVPIPLSNVLPGLVLVVIACASLQRDGLLLCLGLLAAVVLLVLASAAAWGVAATVIAAWPG
jgi:hypothetical protein